jgi:hypothetical protein
MKACDVLGPHHNLSTMAIFDRVRCDRNSSLDHRIGGAQNGRVSSLKTPPHMNNPPARFSRGIHASIFFHDHCVSKHFDNTAVAMLAESHNLPLIFYLASLGQQQNSSCMSFYLGRTHCAGLVDCTLVQMTIGSQFHKVGLNDPSLIDSVLRNYTVWHRS